MRPFNNDQCCFICRRRADGIGTGTEKKVGWLCNECKDLGPEAYKMSDRHFDEFEKRALAQAGEAAGGYLDSLGVTDLAKLQPEEWETFLQTVINTFGSAIRTEVQSGKAPF